MAKRTKQDGFTPTIDMVKVLNVAMDTGVTSNVASWMRAAGVRRQTWWDWVKKPGFTNWFNTNYNEWLDSQLAALKKTALIKGLSGEIDFWREIMARLENGSERIKASINIEGEADSARELLKEFLGRETNTGKD